MLLSVFLSRACHKEKKLDLVSLNSTVLMFALSVCLNTLSSRKYKSFAVSQEFGHSGG
jgi:hypothetical protein